MPEENKNVALSELPAPESVQANSISGVRQASASFGTLPNNTEEFGKVPQFAERKETHTLTVRETARMFETSGVARTERSIINWCQPNRQGITRLDCYYDPNERKYYITGQSVEMAIQEEVQRANKSPNAAGSETFGSHVEHVKHSSAPTSGKSADERKVLELERDIMDLKIANRGKDYLIDQLKDERTGFFEKLLTASRTVGQFETKLNQLDAPKPDGKLQLSGST